LSAAAQSFSSKPRLAPLPFFAADLFAMMFDSSPQSMSQSMCVKGSPGLSQQGVACTSGCPGSDQPLLISGTAS